MDDWISNLRERRSKAIEQICNPKKDGGCLLRSRHKGGNDWLISIPSFRGSIAYRFFPSEPSKLGSHGEE